MDKIPKEEKSGIYQITCKDYNKKIYRGQIKRKLLEKKNIFETSDDNVWINQH